MLIGKYKYSVDSKNRICIPHKFRGDLGAKCVLSKDMLDNCLNLYSFEQWGIFSKKIEELPTIKMRRVRQLIYSNSDEVELDSQGRIVLNQQFCENIGLASEKSVKEVMIVRDAYPCPNLERIRMGEVRQRIKRRGEQRIRNK